jgi:hypothetical protein
MALAFSLLCDQPVDTKNSAATGKIMVQWLTLFHVTYSTLAFQKGPEKKPLSIAKNDKLTV